MDFESLTVKKSPLKTSLFPKDICPSIKKKECIYFSTALAFQGLESKIVVYVDPLETPPKSYSSLDSLKPELIAFNAMGRATTILYLIWDIRLKEYYDKKLKVIGGLKV